MGSVWFWLRVQGLSRHAAEWGGADGIALHAGVQCVARCRAGSVGVTVPVTPPGCPGSGAELRTNLEPSFESAEYQALLPTFGTPREPSTWTAVLRPAGDIESGRVHRLYARTNWPTRSTSSMQICSHGR